MSHLMYRPLQVDLQRDSHSGIPFQLDHVAAPDRPLVPSHAREKGGFKNARRSTFSFYGGQSKAMFVVLTSVTAILFLISTCWSVRARRGSWVLTRRLSDDKGLPHSSIDPQSICEDVGEEKPEELSAPKTSVSTPRAKKRRVAVGGMGSELSPAGDEGHSTSGRESIQASTSKGKRRKRRASELHSGSALSKDKHQTPSEEVPESLERSEQEMEVASALLTLQESFATLVEPSIIPSGLTVLGEQASAPPLPGYIEEEPRDDLKSPWEEPSTSSSSARAPSALLGSSVHDAHHATGGKQSTISSAEQTPAGPAGGDSSSGQSTGAVSVGDEPSTSSAQHQVGIQTPKLEHPFYRLPEVDPVDQQTRRFNPRAATSFGMAFSRAPARLQAIRKLLIMPRLTGPLLEGLALELQLLVAYGCFYEGSSVEGLPMSKAAYTLGRRFLVLDQVLCALQVLGESPSGSWWTHFTAAISNDLGDEGKKRLFRPYWEFNRDLVRRLSRAIEIMKRGQRLGKEETIRLKRALMCLPYSPNAFRKSIWDPWRKDDEDHSQSS